MCRALQHGDSIHTDLCWLVCCALWQCYIQYTGCVAYLLFMLVSAYSSAAVNIRVLVLHTSCSYVGYGACSCCCIMHHVVVLHFWWCVYAPPRMVLHLVVVLHTSCSCWCAMHPVVVLYTSCLCWCVVHPITMLNLPMVLHTRTSCSCWCVVHP